MLHAKNFRAKSGVSGNMKKEKGLLIFSLLFKMKVVVLADRTLVQMTC